VAVVAASSSPRTSRLAGSGASAAPVAGTALVALAVLIAAPAVADLAAHTYRADLWAREGFVVWNANWYGGHHVPGYSVLFPPLGAWLGPRVVGGLAAVVAVWLFGRLTEHRGAHWLFASGVAANVVTGRLPFVLGVAFATAAWWAAGTRPRAAGLLAAGATLASPVAGLFLLVVALARPRHRWRLIVPAGAAGVALGVLFPEGGTERFVASAFWPMFAFSLAAVALLGGRWRVAAALNAALLLAAFVLPTAMGQNAVRLGALLLPVALVLDGARRRPALVLIAAFVYLQWLPAVRAVVDAHGDPSVRGAFYDEVREVAAGRRTEVVFTRNHWEAAHLARDTPIARGWERQVDRKHNALFYDGHLSATAYRDWLAENGIEVVALPTVALDYSARAEAALLRRGVPQLRQVRRSADWTIWEVGRAARGGRVLAPDAVEVRGPEPRTTAERWTRYWRVERGSARLHRDGDRLAVELTGPGPAVVAARLGR
jgi:hypothetical protein